MYWRTALMLCRMRGISPSMLLHPTDYLDITDVPEFTFFPGIRIPAARKMNLVRDVIASLQRHYRPTTMLEHQREVASQSIVSSPSLTIKPQPFLSR
jgi:peptidoglycan-N-acetylglucosamine deacetylase